MAAPVLARVAAALLTNEDGRKTIGWVPCRQEDNWYRWEQEIPAGSPAVLVRAAREFSALKIGYRGDLAFHNAEVIDVPQFLVEGITQGEPVQTNTELWKALSQRIEDEMADYMRRLDLRTRDELIQTADEIDAMMTCDCELRLLGECLPREELVFLLEQDRPLEQMSKAWMEHRNVDVGETFQSLLTGLYAEQQHDNIPYLLPNVYPQIEPFPKSLSMIWSICSVGVFAFSAVEKMERTKNFRPPTIISRRSSIPRSVS